MKKCVCSAFISDPIYLNNLCECVAILGGHPVEEPMDSGTRVSVVYAGEYADTMVNVFKQYGGGHHWISDD